MEKFLTIAEVCERLQLTSQTIYKMIKDGVFPAIRVGLQWRVPEQQFKEWLELQSKEQNAIIEKPSTLVPKAKSVKMLPALKGKTILIADDENFTQAWMREALEPLGVNILNASTGKQAAEMVRDYADTLDLVILDVIMPNGNGLTAYREIREANGDIPVIFSSGYTESNELAQLRANENVSFIEKPFKKNQLVDLLVQVFKSKI